MTGVLVAGGITGLGVRLTGAACRHAERVRTRGENELSDAGFAGLLEQGPGRRDVDLIGTTLVVWLLDAVSQVDQRVVTAHRLEVERATQVKECLAHLVVPKRRFADGPVR